MEKALENHNEILSMEIPLVPPYKNKLFREKTQKFWNDFYKRNSNNFFKDRHWLEREFPELNPDMPCKMLEIGCGVGNTIFPLISENSQLTVFACDFSNSAIEILKKNPYYNDERINAFVADITQNINIVPPFSIDIASCIFVLSALEPQRMDMAVRNIRNTLKKGAVVVVRDYAEGDLAQVRFHSSSETKKLEKNLYLRQDGTLSYFLSLEKLKDLFEGNGFVTLKNELVFRETTNRKENICLKRIFIQSKFQAV